MKYSLQNLGLFVVWAAVTSGLICQIFVEVSRDQWSSGVPAEIARTLNLSFVLVVALIAVANRSPKQMFWIGTTMVALPLFLLQIIDPRPLIIPRNLSLALFDMLQPATEDQILFAQRESHLMQMASVLVNCLTPVLALAGGQLAQTIFSRTTPRGSNS